uniref:Uncharacterized protein n=1 Tax=Ascaris lumbricoides TaxID=6252 RepID=A0A0M3I4L5_ASCLU
MEIAEVVLSDSGWIGITSLAAVDMEDMEDFWDGEEAVFTVAALTTTTAAQILVELTIITSTFKLFTELVIRYSSIKS